MQLVPCHVATVVCSPWRTNWAFFTHSAADLQWPKVAQLICPDNPDSMTAQSKVVTDSPALAYWFFYHGVMEFVKVFYTGTMEQLTAS